MPPKPAEKKTGSAKPGGKDAKGKGNAPAESGDEFDKMTEAQLVEEQRKLQEIYEELKRKRNFFQLEKDQIQQFYDITHQEVQEDEASVRNIEAQMQKMQETHRSAIKLYLQKVVHLEYQHGNALDTMNKEAEVSREMDQRDHDKRKEELLQQCQAEREAMEREEVMYEEEVRNLRELERKEMAKLRDEFERNHTELMAKYEQRLQELKDDLELKRKMEIHEIEERKNKHINDLMRNHERAFTEMKAYYNSITRENLELIKTLKDDLAALKSKALDNEKTIEEVTHRNEMLSEPLSQAESKVAALRARLQNYEKDKASLKLAKARLLVLEDKLQALLAEQESLNAKYLQMEKERDELYAGFEETVIRVQERSNAKNEALSKRLEEYQGAFDTKKVQFATVLRASNLDPVMLQSVMGKLDDVLTSKNDRIQELHYEAQRLTKTKDELEQAMDSHLSKQNIPETVGAVQHPTAEQYVSDESGTLPAGLLSTSRSPKHPQPRSPPRSPGSITKASPNLSLSANAMPIQG